MGAILCICSFGNLFAQEDSTLFQSQAEFTITSRPDQRIEVPFELVHNLIIIEIRLNDSEPLNFILDSGVGSMLLTELPNGEEINLKSTRVVTLAGLGVGEPKKAFLSTDNEIRFSKVIGRNIDVLFLLDDAFTLSNYMGMFVHGLIGYDIFANFAVEINYKKRKIYLYKPEYFIEKFKDLPKHRKWTQYPIMIEDRKPYMDLFFRNSQSDNYHAVKLLIDSGASNAFSFYKITSHDIHMPKKTLPVLLGIGLSGQIPGVLGEIEEVRFDDFRFYHPIVAYPDSAAISTAIQISDRNGSIGGEILKRFKVIFHYPMKSLFLRKNNDFDENFSYNLSGIELITPFPNIPVYIISKIRPNSIADKEGLMEGDIILKINGERTVDMSLNEIIGYLEDESWLTMEVDRDGKRKLFRMLLRNELELKQ